MLTLPIKKKWFDMILSGEKKEEYREIKPYYDTRFMNLFGVISCVGTFLKCSDIGLSERARDYLDKTDYDGGWIPCSERLPENISTVVLQLREIKKPTFGYYLNMGKEWILLERDFIDLKEFSVIA